MKQSRIHLLRASACAPLVLAALVATLPAAAVTRSELTELKALHLRELAACRSGRTGQEAGACVREAHAAYAQAQRGGLVDNGAAIYAANARQRCDALRGDDKADCLARMDGHGTVSGSVESGGLLRELKTYSVGALPVAPSTPASAPPPTPMPVPIDPPR